ncbi:MAG: addiction module antidote protein [Desulfovibrio sp.]|jgi:probable addiction module antidote protein|nr:addiction module antidote protein [Desulfovibrio sp.]
MTRPYISHEEATIASFRRDPDFAAEYLNTVLEDGTQEELMLALRRIAEAFGMKDVAETANLNPKTLYRTLSPAGNPELRSFQAILGAMGMRLAVTPLTRAQ